MERRLYKSRTDRKIAGVCGGIAEYFNIDPVIIRLVVVVFTLAGGAGLIGYIVAAIIIPEPEAGPQEEETDQKEETPPKEKKGNGNRNLGIILILLAVLIALNKLVPWVSGTAIVILFFLGIGLYFLVKKPL